MPKVTGGTNFTNLAQKDQMEAWRFLSSFLSDVQDILNGRLNFNENFQADIIQCNFPSANVEFGFSHKVGRAPIGYIMVSSTAAASLYDGTTTNTKDRIFLRSNAIANVKILVI